MRFDLDDRPTPSRPGRVVAKAGELGAASLCSRSDRVVRRRDRPAEARTPRLRNRGTTGQG